MIDGQSSSSSGWNKHADKHRCDTRCNLGPDREKRRPTFEEFVKYAGLLSAASRGQESCQTILTKYVEAWAQAYPNDSIRLVRDIVEGKQIIAPEDFSTYDGIPTSKPPPINAYIEDASPPPDSPAHGKAPATPHFPVSPTLTSFHSGVHAYS